MVNNAAQYGSLGYLTGDGTHLVNIGTTVAENNTSIEDTKPGVFVDEGTDETTVIQTVPVSEASTVFGTSEIEDYEDIGDEGSSSTSSDDRHKSDRG